ncbi:MAG: hypothetical protein AAF558_06360 [Verrucomicrobiota bacterium]
MEKENAPELLQQDYFAFDLRKFRQALIHIDHGLTTQAIEILEELIRHHPDRSGVWHALGNAYGIAGDHDRSFVAYKTSIQVQSCPSDTLISLAQAFLQSGDQYNTARALKHLHQVRPDLAEQFES